VRSRQTLYIHVRRRFFVEPNEIEGFALKGFAASKVALDADGRDAPANVANLDAVKQVGNPARWHELDDCVFRNGRSTFLPRTADQHSLHGISNRLTRGSSNPRNSRLVEPLSLPPIRIAAGCVNGGFHRASKCLAQLIAGHQKPLAMLGAGGVEGSLPCIKPIVREVGGENAAVFLSL